MIVKPISAAVTAALTVATPAATQQARHWTLEDQLSIPEVGGLSISADGHSAFYVVRVADVASRRIDRKSVVSGKSVSVRVDLGGRRIIKKTKIRTRSINHVLAITKTRSQL